MKKFCKVAASATAGVLFGLLFAQKSGKKLRTELKNAENPAKTLFEELKSVALDSKNTVSTWAKKSEALQNVIASGEEQFDAFIEGAKKLGTDSKQKAQEELEKLSENAKKAAQELKKSFSEKKDELSEKLFSKKEK